MLLLLASGFFSAAETAIVALSPAKVRMLVESKVPGSYYLAKLKGKLHRTLIAIVIGYNLLNILAASLTTIVMAKYFGAAAVGIAAAFVTTITIIFGEMIPKTLATNYTSRIAQGSAPILYVMTIVLAPIIWILDHMVNGLFYLIGTKHQAIMTDEELIAMATIGAEEGVIDEQERELIENVLEFNEIRVEDVMTPRVHVAAIPEEYDLDSATNFVLNHTYTRIPVYRETIDNIVGILYVKELLKQRYEIEEEPGEIKVRQLDLPTPLKVSHNTTIHDLFHHFKSRKTHFAVVLDEHGGTAGIVTMEDLLEELVGNIQDEQDMEEHIKIVGPNRYELSGRLELDELLDLTKLELDYPGYKTLSFLLVELMGRLPHKGEKVRIKNWEFTVTSMWRHTILKVTAEEFTSPQSESQS